MVQTFTGDSLAIRKLVSACRKGDHRAQVEIYQRYVKAMYNTAFRIVQDAALAEDMMQEAFLDAFQHLAKFREESTFGSWLKRIVVNRCLNYLKKRRVDMVPIGDHPVEDTAPEPEGQSGWTPEDISEVKIAIDKLPNGYRVILSLYLLEGYDHEEIAQIMGISPPTSRSQYSRAKQKLRKLIEAERST